MKPIYRGTEDQLTEQKPAVFEWFVEQVRNLEFTKAQMDIIDREIENGRDPCSLGNTFRVDVSRDYIYPHTRSDVADFYYEFHVGYSVRSVGAFGSTTVKLRKDGTLNMKTVHQALLKYADHQIRVRSRRDTFATNRKLYELAGEPMVPGLDVNLSKTVEGQCTLAFNLSIPNGTVKITRASVDIDDIQNEIDRVTAAIEVLTTG